jgi:hypothetical protein
MPRMLEIKTGLNLTIAGPARVIVYGKPTLSGTQPEPQETTNGQPATPAAAAAAAAADPKA